MASKQALFFVACVLVGHTSTLAFTSPSLMRVAPSMPTKHRHFNAKSNVNPTFYGNRRDFSVLFEASAADESKSSSSDDDEKITIYLGCDGFGQDLLNSIKEHLNTKEDITIEDLGCDTYYDAAAKVAKEVTNQNPNSKLGILFCGTGMGVGIVANKFGGVRAATCENVTAARCARAVNNANVLCLGGMVTKPDIAINIVDAFLKQQFIHRPCCGDTGEPVPWWSDGVETFLSTSMDGIQKVEKEASLYGAKK